MRKMSDKISYEAELKNGYIEKLTPEELGEFVHFFTKEEIKSIKEL